MSFAALPIWPPCCAEGSQACEERHNSIASSHKAVLLQAGPSAKRFFQATSGRLRWLNASFDWLLLLWNHLCYTGHNVDKSCFEKDLSLHLPITKLARFDLLLTCMLLTQSFRHPSVNFGACAVCAVSVSREQAALLQSEMLL